MTITISGETLEDIKVQIAKLELKQTSFVGGPINAAIPQSAVAQTPVQAQATSQENVGTPYCVHGLMKWREGTTKAGVAYAGHYCTAKEQSQQCRTVFPKKQIPADQKNVNYSDPL